MKVYRGNNFDKQRVVYYDKTNGNYITLRRIKPVEDRPRIQTGSSTINPWNEEYGTPSFSINFQSKKIKKRRQRYLIADKIRFLRGTRKLTRLQFEKKARQY